MYLITAILIGGAVKERNRRKVDMQEAPSNGYDLSGMGLDMYDSRNPENFTIEELKTLLEKISLKLDISGAIMPQRPEDNRGLIKRIFSRNYLPEFPRRKENSNPILYFQRAFNDFESYILDRDVFLQKENVNLKFKMTAVAGLELEGERFSPEEVRLKYAGFSQEEPKGKIQRVKISKSVGFYREI